MESLTDQQHTPWLRPDASRLGNGYEPPVGIPSEDISDMFTFPHSFESNSSHMNRAANYYSNSARAMAGYGASHGKFKEYDYILISFFFVILCHAELKL